jgi:hypothetical protein
MKNSTLTVFLVLVGLTQTADLSAVEDATDIEAANKLFETMQVAASGTGLSVAQARLPKPIEAGILALFPEPFEGWRAGPPRAREDLATQAMVANSYLRRYLREDGAQVTLGLVIDAPILPFLSMAARAPLASGKHDGLKAYTLYTLDEWSGTLDRKGEESYTITLVIEDRLVVQGHSTGTLDPCALDAYIRALDVDAILAALPKK